MSDHIEINGKTYYESGYLTLANKNVRIRDEKIAALEAENASLRNIAGDNLCWIKPGEEHLAKALPEDEFLESCRRYRAQLAADYGEFPAGKTIAQLEYELADHERGFGLRWKANMRAIEIWRSDDQEKELIWPDHADLCVWLLEERDRLIDALQALRVNACQLGDFMYSAVRECSQDMIKAIDVALAGQIPSTTRHDNAKP